MSDSRRWTWTEEAELLRQLGSFRHGFVAGYSFDWTLVHIPGRTSLGVCQRYRSRHMVRNKIRDEIHRMARLFPSEYAPGVDTTVRMEDPECERIERKMRPGRRTCLSCSKTFDSWDTTRNRICSMCSKTEPFQCGYAVTHTARMGR